MFDFLSFLKLDIIQIMEFIKPVVLPIILLIIPPISFIRSTPIIGLVANRVPIFALACFYSNSLWELFGYITLFLIFGFVGDYVAYANMYTFWLWFINKIPEDSKTDKILKYLKKYPISVTILGTYSSYTDCLITPFARKYDLHWKQFWIPRIITRIVVLGLWGVLWYFLKENAKQFSDLLANVGVLVVLAIFVGLGFNIIYSIRFLHSVDFFGRLRRYLKKK
jgi:hypothetical protein